MTDERKKKLRKKLKESRKRIFLMDMEFAEPLREMIFVATKDVKKISTNGSCIYFEPEWLWKLSENALDFILSHQVMHIALGHINRPKFYRGDRFHLACDIVANSHLAALGYEDEKIAGIGTIYRETFYPKTAGILLTSEKALLGVPFDPAELEAAEKRRYMIDSEKWWEEKPDRGENGIIVLSMEDEEEGDFPEESIGKRHITSKKEIFRYEEDEEKKKFQEKKNPSKSRDKSAEDKILSLRDCKKREQEKGMAEEFTERAWRRALYSDTDWRNLLNSFIQEDVFDYSFTPPDRRNCDLEFFLPDFNVLDQMPKKVLFMVDTSGSVDDKLLSAVYGEICNAINQFNGGIQGLLGFFDSKVYRPESFSGVDDLLTIKPRGGGGTDIFGVFDYVENEMTENPPSSMVIFTDGKGDFPEKVMCKNIPLLWLISDKSIVPPWGNYAYIKMA